MAVWGLRHFLVVSVSHTCGVRAAPRHGECGRTRVGSPDSRLVWPATLLADETGWSVHVLEATRVARALRRRLGFLSPRCGPLGRGSALSLVECALDWPGRRLSRTLPRRRRGRGGVLSTSSPPRGHSQTLTRPVLVKPTVSPPTAGLQWQTLRHQELQWQTLNPCASFPRAEARPSCPDGSQHAPAQETETMRPVHSSRTPDRQPRKHSAGGQPGQPQEPAGQTLLSMGAWPRRPGHHRLGGPGPGPLAP